MSKRIEEVSLDEALSGSRKIMKYLRKKFKSPLHAYMALRFTIIYFETELKIRLPKDEEMFLRKIMSESEKAES